MSCVAIHEKLYDFYQPRLVSSHFTPHNRYRLVRRYALQRSVASQLDAVVGDQNLAAGVLSLFVDVYGLIPTNSSRKKECPVAPKNRLSNDFISYPRTAGQLKGPIYRA
jgi:hypothetical protein